MATTATHEIRNLEKGDEVRIELADGTVLVGELQNEPDIGPPITSDGEAAGWDEKMSIPAIEVFERDGTDYEIFDLYAENHDREWGEVYGAAHYYVHDEGTYENDEFDAEEIETVEIQ